jgi:hypothetical protein
LGFGGIMKTCIKCGEEKPEEAFPSRGYGQIRNDCKTCYNAYRKHRYRTEEGVRERKKEQCKKANKSRRDEDRARRAEIKKHPKINKINPNNRFVVEAKRSRMEELTPYELRGYLTRAESCQCGTCLACFILEETLWGVGASRPKEAV